VKLNGPKPYLKTLLPIILMVLLAVTRIPGLMPPNFSAVYALMFCAGVFFPRKLAWWLPFVTVAMTDVLLNLFYYKVPVSMWFGPEMLAIYGVYAVLVWLGRKFGPKASFMTLLGGGILGALLFYIITNTISWFFNPFHNAEYTKTLTGWLIALTKGTKGWPQTWEFFRNTLMSGGLFTGLFAGAMKLLEALEPAEEEEKEKAEEEAPDAEPEEAKA
jgi:Family of unknown function (DUF6580)